MEERKIYFGVEKSLWFLVAIGIALVLYGVVSKIKDLPSRGSIAIMALSILVAIIAYLSCVLMTGDHTKRIKEEQAKSDQKKAFVVNFIKNHYNHSAADGEIDGYLDSWTVKFTDNGGKSHEVHFHNDQFCEVIG